MRRNQRSRLWPVRWRALWPGSWPLRRFAVVEDSMRPTLAPGDGLLAVHWPRPKPGQIRVFAHPRGADLWLVKRVGEVRGTGAAASFQARSDNPGAPGVVDSRQFGWVPSAGSYRVVWTVRGPGSAPAGGSPTGP